MRSFILCLVVGVLAVAPLSRAGEPADLVSAALAALSDDKEQSATAIAQLRAAGPAGLETLFATYRAAIDRHRENPLKSEPMWERLSSALDAVARQKDAWASGLYWHTDLAEATRAARASNKPILSLRLLGTLDTEFSCANSRFFRTALYPNESVGKMLREDFILHWQSHRPVPRLTIDFGDGRTIERTITGNSVHYILAPDGRTVVDVLPGLYGPAAFQRGLANAYAVAQQVNAGNAERILRDYHRNRLEAVRAAFAADAARVNENADVFDLKPRNAVVLPNAAAAGRLAIGKGRIEMKPVLALMPARAAAEYREDDPIWAKIAALHATDAALDAGSRAVIVSKNPDAAAANRLTRAKYDVETPLARIIRNFEKSVAEDTVHNEYVFHAKIHEWFVNREVPGTLDELNEKVYAGLFLMPKSDPWLGLVPADVYTALPETK